MQKSLHILLIGCAMLFLNACSTSPYHADSGSPVEDRFPAEPEISSPTINNNVDVEPPTSEVSIQAIPETPKPAEVTVPVPVKRSPAVIALLSNADKQQQQGDYRSAQNTLQRAQRIAPRDPQVYYALAETHLELETYALAEQVALKGASLSSADRVQLKRFWNLIAKIRLQAGNPVGAEIAQRRADKY